jgi:hypothetical protein
MAVTVDALADESVVAVLPVLLAVLSRAFAWVFRSLAPAVGAVFSFAAEADAPMLEVAFSNVKAFLKKAAARTKEALLEAITEALRAVTLQDVEGWFAHCAYGTEAQGL